MFFRGILNNLGFNQISINTLFLQFLNHIFVAFDDLFLHLLEVLLLLLDQGLDLLGVWRLSYVHRDEKPVLLFRFFISVLFAPQGLGFLRRRRPPSR